MLTISSHFIFFYLEDNYYEAVKHDLQHCIKIALLLIFLKLGKVKILIFLINEHLEFYIMYILIIMFHLLNNSCYGSSGWIKN